jgi:nitronate monooxygenase
MQIPFIIQGGMGVAISDWRLARAVAQAGELGVVSGTGVSRVLISRLMEGDAGGALGRALAGFPLAAPARAVWEAYYVAGGKATEAAYRTPAPYTLEPARTLDQLTAIANFAEVWLAKEGHAGPVGINLLEKVQLPTLASLYGAMLAGVDVVIMGAGIPTQVAEILDRLATHQPVSYRVNVLGAAAEDDYRIHFDPQTVFPGIAEAVGPLKRPAFLPIVSSVVLAQSLLQRSKGRIDGFVIEGPTAGGHNAPPRGALKLNERGEPVYGERDVVDLEKMKALGLPFWLGGGHGHPEGARAARMAGAAGVQVGSAFALCEESGMAAGLRRRIVELALAGRAEVITSPVVSPTGFPFKVARLDGTLSEPAVYAARKRVCDLGFLRSLYKKEDGTIGYRCSAEPVEEYVRKGGSAAETVGRGCLCNNLMATAGYPQRRKDGSVEPALVTLGDDLSGAARLAAAGGGTYAAADVIAYVKQGLE